MHNREAGRYLDEVVMIAHVEYLSYADERSNNFVYSISLLNVRDRK